MNIDLVSVKQGIEILSPVIAGSAGLIWDATQKKFVAKAGEQVSSAMLEQINNVFNKLRNKSPDNADKLEAAINSDDVIDAENEIIDIIPNILRKDYPAIINQIEYYLQEKLKQGKCLLLLDALDEVPKDDRISLTDKINRFLSNYSCQVICTSRIVGYAGNFIDGGKEVEIVPFDNKKQQTISKLGLIMQ